MDLARPRGPAADGLGRLRALPEAVLEAAGGGAQVLHAARPRGPAADGLGPPVVGPLARRRVPAQRAGGLLDVVRVGPAAPAQRVRLVVALAARPRPLPLLPHGCRPLPAPPP